METPTEGGAEGSEVIESDAPEAPQDNKKPEVTKRETASETVARVLKEQREKQDDGSKDPAQESQADESNSDKLAKKAGKQVKDKPELPQEIEPPARLSAEDKNVFNKLPPHLKMATARMFKDHQAQFTKAQQEWNRAAGEARGYIEAVQPYITELGSQGFTGPAAVATLLATQKRLTDPKTSKETWLQIGRDLGHHTAESAEGSEAQTAPQFDIEAHPKFRAVQDQLNQILSHHQQTEQQKFTSTVDSIAAEFAAVRDQKDATGNYQYPKLHDAEYLERLKPLVSALKGTFPALAYGEVLKRAYWTAEGQNGNSFQPNQTGLHAQTQQPQQVKVVQPAISVRGKSAGTVSGTDPQPPPEALTSAAATARWVIEQQRRGGILNG